MSLPRLCLRPGQRRRYAWYQFLDHFLGRSRAVRLTRRGRKRFYARLLKSAADQPEGKLLEVARVQDISPENFQRNYVQKGIPVVLEGAAKNWACTANWSIDYFADLHGEDDIVFVDQHTMDLSYKELKLRDVLNDIAGGTGKYYRFYPLLEKHPEHLADFDVQWLRAKRTGYSPVESFQVFIGGDKSYTPLHNSGLANLFIQVVGEKHWVLYPNENVAIVDPDPVRNIYRHAPKRKNDNSFNPFKPDYDYPFDLYKSMDGIKVHLKPGDVFYNPPYYWHSVKNDGDSIGVGYRWLPLASNAKKWPMHTLLDLCSRKPTFFKTMKYLKQDVNLLHLAETGELKEYLRKKRQTK